MNQQDLQIEELLNIQHVLQEAGNLITKIETHSDLIVQAKKDGVSERGISSMIRERTMLKEQLSLFMKHPIFQDVEEHN